VNPNDVARYQKIDGMTFEEKEKMRSPGAEIAENPDAYVVRSGDTLDKIAGDHNVSIHQLKLWNNLRTSRIYAGQTLVIHADAAATPVKISTPAPARTNSNVITYVVKNGDTLWDIARVYQVPETDIRKWNNLKRSTIYAGQELIIHTDQDGNAMN
jgi:LysM repeat protein